MRSTLQNLGPAAVPALAERLRRSPDPPGGPANRFYFMALQLLAELPGDSGAVEALQLMERHKVNQVLVVDSERRLVGALNMHDLFRAKVI